MSNPEENIRFDTGYQRLEQISEEPSHALFAAWQNSALNQANAREDREFQSGFLQDLIEKAALSQGAPHRRDLIRVYGDITAYLWFGNDNTPLPRGLKRYLLPDDDTPTLMFDFDYTDGSDLDNVARMLEPLGLKQLLEYRHTLFKEQAPHLFRPLVEALVANTPGYRLLESFNLDQHIWTERALTPVERIFEERAAEEAVRRRHGMSAGDELRHHPGAQTELARAILRLDEVTRYDRQAIPQADSPANRAISFFKGLAAQELNKGVDGNELRAIQAVRFDAPPLAPGDEPRSYTLIRIETNERTENHDPENFVTWAQHQDYLSSPGFAPLRGISTFVITDAIKVLLGKNGQNTSYGGLLQGLLDRYTNQLFDRYSNLTKANLEHPDLSTLATLLALPTEVDKELDWFIIEVKKTGSFDPQRVASRREYKQAMRETIGTIKRRPDDDTDRRIIQYIADPGLGGFDEAEAELLLHFKELAEDLSPTIPGYQLLGYDAKRTLLGFRYTSEADPYTECTTAIPKDARLTLAATYAEIGLHELAMLVHGAHDLTVGQLARDISRTNRYVLPRHSYMPEFPDNLADYAEQVTPEGRLQMQCVGSSHFLYTSLKEVFGSNAVSVIGGDALPSHGRRIPRAGHQQTTFTDPGTLRTYILDATSGGARVFELRDAISNYADSMRRMLGLRALRQVVRSRMAPQATERPHFEPPEERKATKPEERRQAMLEQNRDSLIMQLRMVHGANGRPMRQEDLMNQVANLHPDDIIFRTLSTAILSAGSQADPGEPERILRHIRALKGCDDRSLLRKVDPHEYTRQPRLLNALESALAEIIRLNH